MNRILKKMVQMPTHPILKSIIRPSIESNDDLDGFLKAQRLALRGAKEVSTFLKDGMTEIEASNLLKTYLMDYKVEAFFHYPFAWFGERTRFDGITHYREYAPSRRTLRANEVFILDVAPVYEGHIVDIGYTSSLGENKSLIKANDFLKQLRAEIPSLFLVKSGGDVWKEVDRRIRDSNFENIHQKYPFSVLGHRVHKKSFHIPYFKVFNFGWQSYWNVLSRGIFDELLTSKTGNSVRGLWAIEPHIGGIQDRFGAKFEEILVVEKDRVYWLEDGIV